MLAVMAVELRMHQRRTQGRGQKLVSPRKAKVVELSATLVQNERLGPS